MLNTHPGICVGVERYRFIAMGSRLREFTPDLFEAERFQKIEETDTKAKGFNQQLLRKFSSGVPLTHIGDKIPRLYMRLSHLEKTFPESTLIFTLRDPLEVAYSWQARADNPKDSWAATSGIAAAIEEWVVSVEKMVEALPRWGDRAIIIHYEKFFKVASSDALAANFKALYDRLGSHMDDAKVDKIAKDFWRPGGKTIKPLEDEALAAKLEAARRNPNVEVLLKAAF